MLYNITLMVHSHTNIIELFMMLPFSRRNGPHKFSPGCELFKNNKLDHVLI